MLPVGEFEHSQDTRRAHRAAAHCGLGLKANGVPSAFRKSAAVGRGRGGLCVRRS